MRVLRNTLLWASRNQWLREKLPRHRFFRQSVSRFMPGEDLADALDAAERLREQGVSSVVTRLGENVSDASEALQVRDHYLQVFDEVRRRNLDTEVSVKLTQLGLDIGLEMCQAHLESLAHKAEESGSFVWIDMEASNYTDVTLDAYRRARAASDRVGVCLQAYLRRTAADLSSLLSGPPAAIRLVKGAYAEPPSVAFPRRRDTDANYFELATKLLEQAAKGSRTAIATHDLDLIRRIEHRAGSMGLSQDSHEIQMLYGIRTRDQLELARQGFRVRVLISYGDYWFPWYLRRLAERPANVWFVVKNIGA